MRATVEADMESVQQSTRTSGPVMLSVIIPCRNEVRTIAAVLEDLDRQDFSALFEVIVADGMSGDGTREILDGLIQRAAFRYPLCMVDNPAGTIPRGLNLAVRRATGAYIARIDAHSHLPEDYLRTIFDALDARVGDVVGPQVLHVAPSGTPIAKTIAAMLNTRFGNGGTPSRNHIDVPTKVMHTVMSCYRREVWETIGGYDETLLSNEDYEFDHRANRTGFAVVSLPRPVFRLITRATLGALARQRWRYGRWKARVLILHPGSIKLRQLIPILMLPFALAVILAALPLAVLLGVAYCFAAALSVVREESIRDAGAGVKLQCAALAPPVAAVTHFVWSAGAWYGLVFRPNNKN
jgi:glycosyltransferase involved in cell wall biosynthesis